jgi:hypothetical protein
VLAATIALVAAIILDRFGLFTKAIGDRLAAVLALYSLSVFVAGTPVATWLIDKGNLIAAWLGRFAGRFLGPNPATAISQYLVAMIVLLVAFMWIMAMLPRRATVVAGDAAMVEMSSLIIWGGAFVIVIGGSLIPGQLGELVRSITDLGVSGGSQIAGILT